MVLAVVIRVQLTIGARAWDISTGVPQPTPDAAPVVLDGTQMGWRYASDDEWPSALEPLSATVQVASYDAQLWEDVNEGDPATVRFLAPDGSTIGAVYGQVVDATATSRVVTLDPDVTDTRVLTTWTVGVVDHKGSTLAHQVIKGNSPAGDNVARWDWLMARTPERPSWLPAETLPIFVRQADSRYTYAAVDYTKGVSVVQLLEAWAAESFEPVVDPGGKPNAGGGAINVLVALHAARATLAMLTIDRQLVALHMPATLAVVNGLLTLAQLPAPVTLDPLIPALRTRAKVVPGTEVELEGGNWRLDRSRGVNAATATGNGNLSRTAYRDDYTLAGANMRTVSTTLTDPAGLVGLAELLLTDPPPNPWDRDTFVWWPSDAVALTDDAWFPDLRADHPRYAGQDYLRAPGCLTDPVVVTGIGPRWNLGSQGSTYAGLLQRVTISVDASRYRVDFKLRRQVVRPRRDDRTDIGGTPVVQYEATLSWLKANHPTVRLRTGSGPKVDPGMTIYDLRLVRTPNSHA